MGIMQDADFFKPTGTYAEKAADYASIPPVSAVWSAATVARALVDGRR
ncbi:hypothetical protein RCH12_002723 [Cryobacterium sp. MP_3.1]|nr:hypothetical protein [Cryobacterium sp. MP_3.1]